MKSDFIEISDELFLELGKLITERYGIKLPPEKKIMFQARLQRRLRELKIDSFDEYALKMLKNQNELNEFNVLADYISTNKTDFFREIDHFHYITNQVLPEFMNLSQIATPKSLNIWSAGCSSGQEAYSIGITLEEFMQIKKFKFDYSILATDISDRMLKSAKLAIYPVSLVQDMPIEIKHRYFLKSKNIQDQKVRVLKEIRDRVRVAYMNLMDDSYSLDKKFDVIFLRNTLIYFDPKVQLMVLTKVINNLHVGGYLFIGHSESLINLPLPIRSVAPSVYVKTNI